MITATDYFRDPSTNTSKAPSAPNDHHENAEDLLVRVNALIDEAMAAGAFHRQRDPDTGTEVSGTHGGSGDGGYRLPDSTTGAPNSSHREGRGIDVYDPREDLDNWITDECLERHGLYREHPSKTRGWCHLTTRSPGSGLRTFMP